MALIKRLGIMRKFDELIGLEYVPSVFCPAARRKQPFRSFCRAMVSRVIWRIWSEEDRRHLPGWFQHYVLWKLCGFVEFWKIQTPQFGRWEQVGSVFRGRDGLMYIRKRWVEKDLTALHAYDLRSIITNNSGRDRHEAVRSAGQN